jgi:hypothetical protein
MDIPILQRSAMEPARVVSLTILVTVHCQQCLSTDDLVLVNAQPAVCPSCGALLSLDRVTWDNVQQPSIALSASRPVAQAFQ